MSLQRELAIIFSSVLSVFFLVKATFLSVEQMLIVPSDHPLLLKQQSVKIDKGFLLQTAPYSFVRGNWQFSAY